MKVLENEFSDEMHGRFLRHLETRKLLQTRGVMSTEKAAETKLLTDEVASEKQAGRFSVILHLISKSV